MQVSRIRGLSLGRTMRLDTEDIESVLLLRASLVRFQAAALAQPAVGDVVKPVTYVAVCGGSNALR